MASPRHAPPRPGIYVPVPTFFSRTSSIFPNSPIPPLDLNLQSAYTLHLAQSGIHGLVIAGSTGEAVHLSRSERKCLISHTRKTLTDAAFPTDYPLIAGVACENVEGAIELLRDAKEAGAQWGLVLIPGYFAGTGRKSSAGNMQEGIARWFGAVADRSELPILIYNYPAVTNNVTLSQSTYARLIQYPKIVGCKLSHGDVSTHTTLAVTHSTSNFLVLTGLGQQLFPVIAGGCHGAIDGLAGIFPKSLVHLFNLSWQYVYSDDGDVEERKRRLKRVREVQLMVGLGEEFVGAEGTVGIKYAVGKEILKLPEGEAAEGRVPLQGGLTESEWKAWDHALVRLRELEASL